MTGLGNLIYIFVPSRPHFAKKILDFFPPDINTYGISRSFYQMGENVFANEILRYSYGNYIV